jgi:glycerophosphoryl diester phosphodiesterase
VAADAQAAASPDLLVFAHRGEHHEHPANTLEAFAAAIRAGANGIETDIRLTRDGQTILFHDRVAPNGIEVSRLTAAELTHAAGYVVPTLTEALERFPAILWNLEIKTAEAAVAALPAIAQAAEASRLLISSFWHPLLDAFDSLPLAVGQLIADRPRDLKALLGLIPPGKVRRIVWDYEMLDEGLVSAASRHGVFSLAYGMDTDAEHRRCRDLAAQGLLAAITDRPRRLREILAEPRSGD